MSDFASIQSSLANKLKAVKSLKDLSLAFISEKHQNNFWSAIHHKLLYDKKIPLGAKVLWTMLQDAGDANGYSYCGQKLLSVLIGRGEKTIQRYTKKLIDSGWLIVKKGRRHQSNEYWVIWPGACPNPKLKSAVKKSKATEKR